MQILFHLGAHRTDGGLLIRSILRNRARLSEEGIVVPGPSRYRELLGEVSTKLRGDAADDETEAMLMEAICDDNTAERLVLSNESFLCRIEKSLGPDGLYPKAEKAAWLRQCFPSHWVEFAFSIRNPATFVPEILTAVGDDMALDALPLESLLWSDVIADIAAANPGAPILCWCHEDTPFIWSEVMRELTGHDPYMEIDGEFDMLETIMSPEGMQRLSDFLESRNITDQIKRRRAVSAFLEAHAIEDAVETEIDMPGWTDETVQTLTELYEEDVARIASMSGVTLLAP